MTRKAHDDYRDDPLLPLLRVERQMEEIRRYFMQGRRFAGLTRDKLERFYAACVWLVQVKDVDRSGLEEALADLGAELALRRLPEPMHLIEPWLPAIRARWEEGARDPETRVEMGRMLDELERQLAQPKN